MSLTVFTVANPAYEPFVLPYVLSVLQHNSNTHVEIALESPKKFTAAFCDAIDILRDAFGDKFSFVRNPILTYPPNSHRFMIEPEHKSEYVYIGDIDILVLEPIAPHHLAHMRKTGLPYSNMIRTDRKALTGLHFTKFDAFYPAGPLPEGISPGLDEEFLYAVINARGLPLPDPADGFRPLHGVHLTVNRDHKIHNRWASKTSKKWAQAYFDLARTPLWQSMAGRFDIRYRILLAVFEATICNLFPDLSEGFSISSGTQIRQLWTDIGRLG